MATVQVPSDLPASDRLSLCAPRLIRTRYGLRRVSSCEAALPPVNSHPEARFGRLGSSTRSQPGVDEPLCTTGTQVGPPSSVAGSTANAAFPGAAYRTC